MDRSEARVAMKVAGYHEDSKRFTRLYIESTIGKAQALRAFEEGQKQREAGIKCDCKECQSVQEN